MPGLGLNEPPEEPRGSAPVHYQISITGKQAGFFFLLLLVALGLSFFFGMKTGAAARRGPGGAAAVIASASDIPVPTLVPAEGVREEKKPDETLGIRPEEKRAAAEPAAALASTSAPPTPAPKPTAAPAAKPTARPTAKPTPKPAPKGPFHVQVLATKNAASADELAKRLRGEGFAADVATIPGKPGWFRVHVGPFKDRARAEAVAKKIKATDKQIKNVPIVVP